MIDRQHGKQDEDENGHDENAHISRPGATVGFRLPFVERCWHGCLRT